MSESISAGAHHAVDATVEDGREGESGDTLPHQGPPHLLQRESYHQTGSSPVVEAVRQGLQDASNEEDSSYAELLERSDGTVEGAIYLWLAAQCDPVLYNPFQKMYFKMVRDPKLVEEGYAEGEGKGDRQARMKELYNTLQTELYGDDHRIFGR